jgi:biotin-(acetyl-CoA carboxylase) ligase
LVETKRGDAFFCEDATTLPLVIIGIGVNVNRPQEGAFAGAAYLNDATGERLELEAVAAAVINQLFDHCDRWLAAGCSFAPFAAEYRAHMALLGQEVCVRSAQGALIARGTVQGIDNAAQLLLQGPQTMTTVTAGEVTLRDY